MRVVHITDPHFDCVSERFVEDFARRVASDARSYGACQVVITGDIASADSLEDRLSLFCKWLGGCVSVSVVLGNHDSWGSSLAETRRIARSIDCTAARWRRRFEPGFVERPKKFRRLRERFRAVAK